MPATYTKGVAVVEISTNKIIRILLTAQEARLYLKPITERRQQQRLPPKPIPYKLERVAVAPYIGKIYKWRVIFIDRKGNPKASTWRTSEAEIFRGVCGPLALNETIDTFLTAQARRSKRYYVPWLQQPRP